jgi:hypothetical protein
VRLQCVTTRNNTFEANARCEAAAKFIQTLGVRQDQIEVPPADAYPPLAKTKLGAIYDEKVLVTFRGAITLDARSGAYDERLLSHAEHVEMCPLQ